MVMPSMPIPFNASFTSSSLKGWTIASIFFIRFLPLSIQLGLKVIAFFAMQADIQPCEFFPRVHSNADRRVADLQSNVSTHNRKYNCDAAACRLVRDLHRIAVH